MAKAKFNIEVHEAAGLFPMMPDDELKELADSIVKHGLREKIKAIPQVEKDVTNWVVIDGRNRLAALRFIGVSEEAIFSGFVEAIDFKKYSASPSEYVVMANLERRQLTQPQRKELAGKLAVKIAEEQKDKPKDEQVDSLDQAAKLAGVSRRTAANAKRSIVHPARPRSSSKQREKVATPLSVIKRLEDSLDAMQKSAHNWPIERLTEAQSLVVKIDELLGPAIETQRVADEAAEEEALRAAAASA